jgi:cellulose synthase/poly-beta-1,6-N-acetylglucosamine synthase-like glycosyltransferase
MSALTELFLVAGWLAFAYFLAVNGGFYTPVHLIGLLELRASVRDRRWTPDSLPDDSPFLPGIAIVSPAYNESSLIGDAVRSFLRTDYPNKEVIIVNDGSTDDTLDILKREFTLRKVDERVPEVAPCKPVRNVYRSASEPLVVIDKENGGLGDAQNAGVWFTTHPLVCIVDADTILNPRGLFDLFGPFLQRPAETVAVGGILHSHNAFDFENGVPLRGRIPSAVVGFQIVEYFRAFYSARLGLARLGCLHLISGGVGLFRTDIIRAVNGYNTIRSQHAEDLDLVLRIHKYMRNRGDPYRIDFVPDPVAWTDFPKTVRELGHQRRLWLQGFLQILSMHRDMIGRPKYGLVGVFVLPGLLMAEGVGRFADILGYLVVTVGVVVGAITLDFFLLFALISVGLSTLFSWVGIVSDVVSFRHYNRPSDAVRLLFLGLFECLGFRQVWSVLSLPAVIDHLRDDVNWATVVDGNGRFRHGAIQTPVANGESTKSVWKTGPGSASNGLVIAGLLVAVIAVLAGGIVVLGIGPFADGGIPGNSTSGPIATAQPVADVDAVTIAETDGTALLVAPGGAVTFTVEAADPGGSLGGVEWYVGEFQGEQTLSGATDTGTWTQTFDSVGTHYVEAAVFDSQRRYADDPATWTATVVDPTATRGQLDATTIDADMRAIYVWAGSAERLATDDGAATRFYERVDEIGVNTVFLDSYVVEDAPDAAVASFVETAHERDLRVVALVGAIGTDGVSEAERLTEAVVGYNAAQTAPARFDGLQYDVEPGTDDETTMFRSYVAFLDRVESVGAAGATVESQALTIGADVGPGWLDRAPTQTDRLITHPQVDYLVVQAYEERASEVRSQLQTVVNRTDIPYVLAVETGELPSTVPDENVSVYEQGPGAATSIVRDIERDPPSEGYRGTALHFYGSGVSQWDSILDGNVATSNATQGESLNSAVRVVFDDYFHQSAHRSLVVVVFDGPERAYLAATPIEPPGWQETDVTVSWVVPDDASTGEYQATALVLDTTFESIDRRATGARAVPVELDRRELGTVTIRNESAS